MVAWPRSLGFAHRCMFGVQPDLTLSLVGPCNRATVRYFHRFPCRSRFLRTLARSRVESFDKMLDAAAALGFATAMDVSGVNIVGIEQQRDFARRGQLRWPRESALVEWHDGNIHTTNFPPAKSAVRYARWSNSPCAAASCDSTSPTKGEHSTRRPPAPRSAHWAATDGRV